MGLRSVVAITCAPAGSGKSYVRCARFLVEEFLPEREGVHYSNFPLGQVPAHHAFPPEREGQTFIERIADAVAKKTGKAAADYERRIVTIPDETLERWRDGTSGPWETFHDVELTGAHIAIDEVHVYCGAKHPKPIRQKWQAWLGEIRHRGATVELISQHENKIATELVYEAGAKISLVKLDDERDPFFGILLGDWYELRAKFITGEYTACVMEIEKRDVDGKWRENNRRRFWLRPEFFRFYDSFSAPQSGSGQGSSTPAREFQKRTAAGLVRWFVVRNLVPLFSRMGMALFVVWLVCGGGSMILDRFLGATRAIAEKNQAATKTPPKDPGRIYANGVRVTHDGQVFAKDGTKIGADGKAIAKQARPTLPSPALPRSAERIAAREAVKMWNEPPPPEEVRAWDVVLMTPEEAVTRCGVVLTPGVKANDGPYRGQVVERLDYANRSVHLKDGRVLRLVRPADSERVPVARARPVPPVAPAVRNVR